MAVVAVAFTPAPASQNPNLRVGDDAEAGNAYYSAMLLSFASAARFAPDVRLRLVSDAGVPARYAADFARLGVEVLSADFQHRPPMDFSKIFNASLYTLDAMRELSRAFPDEPILLLDPDCIVVNDLTPLLRIAERGIGVFPTGFPAHEDSNGLSAIEATEIHAALDPSLCGTPLHYGGECYAFTSAQIEPVLERAEAAFDLALTQAQSGGKHFSTEEHILNYALRRANLVHAEHLVDRIWTAPVLRRLSGREPDLCVWHLPAEKDRGFVALKRSFDEEGSWFWIAPDEEFRRRVGREFGIPRRNLARWSYDTLGAWTRRLQRQLRLK